MVTRVNNRILTNLACSPMNHGPWFMGHDMNFTTFVKMAISVMALFVKMFRNYFEGVRLVHFSVWPKETGSFWTFSNYEEGSNLSHRLSQPQLSKLIGWSRFHHSPQNQISKSGFSLQLFVLRKFEIENFDFLQYKLQIQTTVFSIELQQQLAS